MDTLRNVFIKYNLAKTQMNYKRNPKRTSDDVRPMECFRGGGGSRRDLS